MDNTLTEVLAEVLGRITPTKEDREQVDSLATRLEETVAETAKKKGVKAKVRIEGSVAKDTWLKGNPDLDIFIRLPPSTNRKDLEESSLEIAREATKGAEQLERFAEHPYLEAFVDGFRVNIVPCYDTKRGNWLSATDRTPFHTDYMKKELDRTLREEIRLLKKFMQGIGVYGAEIKIGGFSGYLCELLALKYKSFVGVLRAFADRSKRIAIDIENCYQEKPQELELGFIEPLVVIDPADERRNVASAVTSQKLDIFTCAARAFLETPRIEFFFPQKTKTIPTDRLEGILKLRGSSLVFVVFKAIEAVPDILWGQYYRTQRSIRKTLELGSFWILRDAVWTDEKTLCVIIVELEEKTIPRIRSHLGPPIERKSECRDFLAKYAGCDEVISGPYVENGRWIVNLPRNYVDASELLRAKLQDGGKKLGVADLVARALKESFSVKVNEEIAEIYQQNEDFAIFLTDFLDGKPSWLKAA
jgi:tRNA nucleotidyltransferase (CCA-adding enzyme)